MPTAAADQSAEASSTPTPVAGRGANLLAKSNLLDVARGVGGINTGGIEGSVNYFVPLKVKTRQLDTREVVLWIVMVIAFVTSFTNVGTGTSQRDGFYACKEVSAAVDYEKFREIAYFNDYQTWWLGFMSSMGMWTEAARRARAGDSTGESQLLLLGSPRVRQVRSKLVANPTPSWWQYSDYTSLAGIAPNVVSQQNKVRTESRESFNDTRHKGDMYTFQSAEQLDEKSHSSLTGASYGGGGFVLNVSRMVEPWVINPVGVWIPAAIKLPPLADKWMPTAWVDQNTRCIFHDFTLFNPSTTVAVRVRMVIEVLPAGSMHTSVSLDVIDGFDMRIKFSLVAVVIEILFWLIAAKFVWDELFSFLSIWQELRFLVPLHILTLSLNKKTLQLMRTEALSTEVFDPRDSMRHGYLYPKPKSSMAIRPGLEDLNDEEDRLDSMYETSPTDENKRKWLNAKSDSENATDMANLARTLQLAVLWDLQQNEGIKVGNHPKSQKDDDELQCYVYAFTAGEQAGDARLSLNDVDWLALAWQYCEVMFHKYSIKAQDVRGGEEHRYWLGFVESARQDKELFQSKQSRKSGKAPGSFKNASSFSSTEKDAGVATLRSFTPEELVLAQKKKMYLMETFVTCLTMLHDARELQMAFSSATKVKYWDGGGFAMNTAALYQNRIHNFNECGVLLEKLLAQVPEGLSKGYNLREDERAQLLQVQIDVTTDQLRGLVACAVAEGYHWPGSPGWRSSIDLRMKASGRIDATATGPEMEDECVTDNPMRAGVVGVGTGQELFENEAAAQTKTDAADPGGGSRRARFNATRREMRAALQNVTQVMQHDQILGKVLDGTSIARGMFEEQKKMSASASVANLIDTDKKQEQSFGPAPWRRHAQLIDGDENLDIDMDDSGSFLWDVDAADSFSLVEKLFRMKLWPGRFTRKLLVASLAYMEDGWNYVDVANYIGLVGVFVLRVMIFNEAAVVSKQLLSLTEDGFINMHRMSELKNMSLAITAVNSILMFVKLFKYLRFVPQLDLLVNVLSKAAGPVLIFMVVCLVPMVGFGMAFYLAYGNLMWEFSTFTSALESTLLMTLGNYDFESMIYKQPLVGQLLFWLYMLMGFFVLLNMFIAIIGNSYTEVASQNPDSQDFEALASQVLTVTTKILNFKWAKDWVCGGEEVEKAGGNLSKEQTKKERLVIAQNDLAEYSVNRSALGTLSEHAYWEMTGWLIADCDEIAEYEWLDELGTWHKHSEESNLQIRTARLKDDDSVDLTVQVPDRDESVQMSISFSSFEQDDNKWAQSEAGSAINYVVRQCRTEGEDHYASQLEHITDAMALSGASIAAMRADARSRLAAEKAK